MDGERALSVHNLAFLEALLEDYRNDPSSVDPEWIPLLNGQVGGSNGAATYGVPLSAQKPVASDASAGAEEVQLQNRVDDLIEAFRLHGHLGADLDPLGRDRRTKAPMLDPENFGLDDSHLDREFHSSGLMDGTAPLRDILQKLRNTYCRRVGVEYWGLPNAGEREWLRQRMEAVENEVVPHPDEQVRLLRQLTNVEVIDQFLHSKFLGAKRFSVSGAEGVIAMLDQLIEEAGEVGLSEVIFGMAHRGRLNVLMNIMGKSPAEVFSEFEKGNRDPRELLGAGDVKYHMGYHRHHTTSKGQQLYLALAFNPSHLEAITPVIQGRVRAKQDAMPELGLDASLGVTLHGDAAFAGQGVVAETLNMSQLEGYRTGGVVRIVINNQVGFTTDPIDGRSGLYCTDVAHILQVPIFHVNGDDSEAAAYVARLAVEYRQQFQRDVIIDLVCYRRFGHNEGDDPTFTQPGMYDLIKDHPSVQTIYKNKLIERGTVTAETCKQMEEEFHEEFNTALQKVRDEGPPTAAMSPMHGMWENYDGGPEPKEQDPNGGLTRDEIRDLGLTLVTVPEGFAIHRKVKRLLGEAQKMFEGETPFNWAAAELLAYASLLEAGHPVRVSGQDSRRGTFSHRHAVFTDTKTGEKYCPLDVINPDEAKFSIYNSPLSEFGVMGFEFGYSLAAPASLVVWEAQFGDFANGAQVIIDQFLSSSEDKWNRISGLTLLLPHGYEGQGPEHSSARLERFLQLFAEDNMQVCTPTTPAQMFHMLRRQVLRRWRKPLVVMSPKFLLRYRPSFSPIEELSDHGFERVIDDAKADPAKVTRIIMSAGKVYYDLLERRDEMETDKVALVRVEQLTPFPRAEVEALFKKYDKVTELVWTQEEPHNMGPWFFVRPLLDELGGDRFSPRYAGREESASPATGSPDAHQLELSMLLDEAFNDL